MSQTRNPNQKGFSLVEIIIGSSILSLIVVGASLWLLNMNQSVSQMDEKLYASSIAMNEWEKLSHMTMNELEESREKLKEKQKIGDYEMSINLGEKGTFSDGVCGKNKDGIQNCFSDSEIKIFKNDEEMFSSKTFLVALTDDLRFIRNDSYPKHTISMQYDEQNDAVYNYLDGEKVHFVQIPDYEHPLASIKRIWSNASSGYGGKTEHDSAFQRSDRIFLEYVAPQDVFISCYTTSSGYRRNQQPQTNTFSAALATYINSTHLAYSDADILLYAHKGDVVRVTTQEYKPGDPMGIVYHLGQNNDGGFMMIHATIFPIKKIRDE